MIASVELREITGDNIDEVLELRVSEEQSDFVQPIAVSLAKAWAFRSTAFSFAVYAHDKVVGFIMLGHYELKWQYTVWQFLIDERFQNRGYGREALRLGIHFLTDRFDVKEVYLGVKHDNLAAKGLYSSFGFAETGESTETAVEMKLTVDDKQGIRKENNAINNDT